MFVDGLFRSSRTEPRSDPSQRQAEVVASDPRRQAGVPDRRARGRTVTRRRRRPPPPASRLRRRRRRTAARRRRDGVGRTGRERDTGSPRRRPASADFRRRAGGAGTDLARSLCGASRAW